MTGTTDSDIIEIAGAALICADCGLDAAAFSGVCESSGGVHAWGLRASEGEVVAILPPVFGSGGESNDARDKFLRADGGGVWQPSGDARRNGYEAGSRAGASTAWEMAAAALIDAGGVDAARELAAALERANSSPAILNAGSLGDALSGAAIVRAAIAKRRAG